MTTPRTPPGRYDAPRGTAARPLLTGLAVLLALVAVGGGYLLFARATGDRASAAVLGYTVVSDRQVDVRFEVRRPAGRAAVCVVRARDAAGVEVGSEDVPVPATGPAVVRLTHSLATRGRAAAGEVDRCAVRP